MTANISLEYVEARFWKRVHKTDDCWLWQGAISATGHGFFRRHKRKVYAHRYAYQLVGLIPTGMILHHKCWTPNCVRPAHLEPVTRGENSRRGLNNPPIREFRSQSYRVRTVKERFWENTSANSSDACWLWTGGLNRAGYGRLSVGGRRGGPVLAHRWAYESFVGPIPEGLVLDHLCRTPNCVNPYHLEPVTQQENTRRADLSGNGQHFREKTHCPQGHSYSGANLYTHRGHRHCRACRSLNTMKWRTNAVSV